MKKSIVYYSISIVVALIAYIMLFFSLITRINYIRISNEAIKAVLIIAAILIVITPLFVISMIKAIKSLKAANEVSQSAITLLLINVSIFLGLYVLIFGGAYIYNYIDIFEKGLYPLQTSEIYSIQLINNLLSIISQLIAPAVSLAAIILAYVAKNKEQMLENKHL